MTAIYLDVDGGVCVAREWACGQKGLQRSSGQDAQDAQNGPMANV